MKVQTATDAGAVPGAGSEGLPPSLGELATSIKRRSCAVLPVRPSERSRVAISRGCLEKARRFADEARSVRVHVHRHRKALCPVDSVVRALKLPRHCEVSAIPGGCCGMGGAFSYRKDHYPVSMKVAELVLLPTFRAAPPDDIVAAFGTRCRHQMVDGSGRRAKHTAGILWEALEASSADERVLSAAPIGLRQEGASALIRGP